MYKVGDEVLIKGAITNEEDYGAVVFVSGMGKAFFNKKELIPIDKTYEKGLEDAMELLRKVKGLSVNERKKILGYISLDAIITDLTMEYVADQLEAYEKEKEIKVGDVVNIIHNGSNGVVVKILESGGLNVVLENGIIYADCSRGDCIKTGKHIDIESLLNQIGE